MALTYLAAGGLTGPGAGRGLAHEPADWAGCGPAGRASSPASVSRAGSAAMIAPL
jgi:hypothetical protein